MASKTWSDLIEDRKHKDHTQKMIDYEDKIASKTIAEKHGCLIPKTYYIGKSAKDIPFSELPESYVVKPSHHASSRGVFLMHNGINMLTGKKTSTKEIFSAEKNLLKTTLSKSLEEWATYRIPPRVIVEEFLLNLEEKYTVPDDYKCFVFHGRVCMVRVSHYIKNGEKSVEYFNRNFEIIDFDPVSAKRARKTYDSPPTKPPNYDKMIEIVEKMGKEFGDFIRIDMYLTIKGPYFGEFTLYPGSGRYANFTKTIDKYMGALWQKPELVIGEGEMPFTKPHFEKVLESLKVKIPKKIKLINEHVKTNLLDISTKIKTKKCHKCNLVKK